MSWIERLWFVGLGPKTYLYLTDDYKEENKAKVT